MPTVHLGKREGKLRGLLRLVSFSVLMLLAVMCQASRRLPPAPSGEYLVDVFGLEDGLPGQVLSMAQTADGHLWLGTMTGLCKYDGFSITKVDLPQDSQTNSTYANILLLDRQNRLWVNGNNHLSYLEQGHWRSLAPLESQRGFDSASQIVEAPDGCHYILADAVYSIRHDQISLVSRFAPAGPFTGSPELKYLYVDGQNRLWGINRNAGFFFGRYDPSLRLWVKEPYPGDIGEDALGALSAPNGDLLVVEKAVVRRFDGHTCSLNPYFNHILT